MARFDPTEQGEWRSRKVLAWGIRALTVLLPLVAAVTSMVVVARVVHRPHSGAPKLAWYALLLGESWAVARLVSRGVDRTLPLAALLEMSLSFPENAPNRLGLSQRASSASMLADLAVSPPDETAQEAAERILRLLTALSSHDRFTRGHAERVRAYTDLIAEKMELTAADRERLRWAALLHDIGKLQVPSGLLNKEGKPTAAEWDTLRQHPLAGAVIAAPLLAWLSPMDRVIAEHHERFDGTGYPVGLAGEDISFGARIVTVADSFEAMTAARPYSTPLKRDQALREVVRCAGKQFDPLVVRAFLAIPHRRLVWAMGPAAWLTGLPAVGQGSLNVARTAAAHAGTAAVGVTSIAVVAFAPAALASSGAPAAPLATAVVPAAVVPTTLRAIPSTTAQPSTPAQRPSAPASVLIAPPSPTTTPLPAPAPAPTTTRRAPKKIAARHASPTGATSTESVRRTTSPPALSTILPSAPARTNAPTPVTTSALPIHATVPSAPRPAPAKAKTAKPVKPEPTKPAKPAKAAPVAAKTPPAPVTPAPAPAPAPAAPPASVPAQCVASYVLTPAQGDQFAATTTVRNTGAAATHTWTVTWTFGGKEQVQSFGGTALTQTGQRVSAANAASNGALASGSTTTFWVSGARNGAAELPTVTCAAT